MQLSRQRETKAGSSKGTSTSGSTSASSPGRHDTTRTTSASKSTSGSNLEAQEDDRAEGPEVWKQTFYKTLTWKKQLQKQFQQALQSRTSHRHLLRGRREHRPSWAGFTRALGYSSLFIGLAIVLNQPLLTNAKPITSSSEASQPALRAKRFFFSALIAPEFYNAWKTIQPVISSEGNSTMLESGHPRQKRLVTSWLAPIIVYQLWKLNYKTATNSTILQELQPKGNHTTRVTRSLTDQTQDPPVLQNLSRTGGEYLSNNTWMWAYEDLQTLRDQLSKETKQDLSNLSNNTWIWAYEDLQTLRDQLSTETKQDNEADEPQNTNVTAVAIEEARSLCNNKPLYFVLTWLGIFAAVIIGVDGILFAFYCYKKYQLAKHQHPRTTSGNETEEEIIDLEDSGHYSTDIISWNAVILEDP